jgi:hypothetical protein
LVERRVSRCKRLNMFRDNLNTGVHNNMLISKMFFWLTSEKLKTSTGWDFLCVPWVPGVPSKS